MDNSSGSEESDDDYDDINYNDKHIDDEIVDEFILTFSNGDYDAEFNEALNLDRIESVPLPNQTTQASYNKPDNWVERNQTGLTKVRKQLLTYIDKVLLGTRFKLELTLTDDDWDLPIEESIVWHEPILNRYWDVLEAEIDRRKQLGGVTDISCIQITNVEMTKECINALVDICRNGRVNNSCGHVTVDFDNVTFVKRALNCCQS
jgi:hypothetical protein